MRHFIKAIAAAVLKYRAELLAAKETIVEAVHGDLYWSCGLSKEDVRWQKRETGQMRTPWEDYT